MADDQPPERRSRRRIITPDEARVWRAVVRDVAPLPGKTVPDDETKDASSSPLAPQERPEHTGSSILPFNSFDPVLIKAPARQNLPDLSHGLAPGLDRRTADRMKKGEMGIDGTLDLHGLSQDLAHAQLSSFIVRGHEAGRRCLLVITGKGRDGAGILRAQVPRWLNQSPLRERILGFSHARPQHGGQGALYVLVRRRRP